MVQLCSWKAGPLGHHNAISIPFYKGVLTPDDAWFQGIGKVPQMYWDYLGMSFQADELYI